MNVMMSRKCFSQQHLSRCFMGCYWNFYFCRMGSRMQQFSTVQHMWDRKSGAQREQIKVYGEPVSTVREEPTLSKDVCLYERNNP